MKRLYWIVVTTAFSIFSIPALAQTSGQATFTPSANLKWSGTGVETAAVAGDMAKGASHFYLKYPAGFVAPPHHHSADHFATTVSGSLVLIVDGKETRLAPGSFFSFTGKAVHAARCESREPCVMFIDARGPWDAVFPKTK